MLRVSSFIISLVFSFSIYSQIGDSTVNKKSSLGFSFGMNQSALFNSNKTDELQIHNALGFRLGVLSSFIISEQWALVPKAELSFNYGKIIENNVSYRVDPNNLDFMTHLKYKYKGYDKKVKLYSYFGPNLRIPLPNEYSVVTYNTQPSLAIDFGVGVDIDNQYFRFSPELRFSGGLTDIRANPSGKMLRGSNAALVLSFSSK